MQVSGPANLESAGDNGPGRVMVVALDGATWDLARPWMEAGHMPHLSSLVTDGVSAGMRAEMPPSSVPNWPAFMTGKNAGKHGCLWWLQRDSRGRIDQTPVDSRAVVGETLWSHLSAHGKRVVVQNVPVTYPVEPVNGVMVSGLLTPRGADDYVFPPELKAELDAAVGGYHIYPQGAYGKGRELTYLEALIENIRQHARAAEFMLGSLSWEFFLLVLGPTDECAHKYWHYTDPTHERYRSEDAARLGDALQRVYSAADEVIGQLARHLKAEDTLIVLSDHGFGPLERFFLPNNWLLREGFLRLKRGGATPLKHALFRLGLTPSRIFPLGKQVLALLPRSGALRQRLDPGRQGGRSPLRKVFLSAEDIDWSRTRAIASGFLCSQIYINLCGREPDGIVDVDEYEPLRDRLIAELGSVVDPLSGAPHYAGIFRREDLYQGPLVDRLPDLLCVPADLRAADAGMDFRSNTLFAREMALSGTHREQGIFAMRGPGVRRGAVVPPVRIFDFAPTILHRLGLPVPDDMDGQVVAVALEPDWLSTHPVERAPLAASRRGGSTGYSEEQEALVVDRLRDLGYLD